MDSIKEYIQTFGDRYVILVKDDETKSDMGYYAGSIKPYCSCWEMAKPYKSISSARNICAKQHIQNCRIVAYSELSNYNRII